jgi:hypothetical protein
MPRYTTKQMEVGFEIVGLKIVLFLVRVGMIMPWECG